MTSPFEIDTIRIKGKPIIKIFISKVLQGNLYSFNSEIILTEDEVKQLIYELIERLKI